MAGKLWVAGGLIFFVSAFLPIRFALVVMFLLILVEPLAPVAYSYGYYRKQCREGTWKKQEKTVTEKEKRFTVISAVLAVAMVIFVLVICFTGDVAVQFGDDAFTIEASYWDDLTVAYRDVGAVEYREGFKAGWRTFGFGTPRLSLGAFQNEAFGSYTLYGYTGCKTAVVLTIGEETLVLTGRDATETEALYRELETRVQ